MNADELRAVQAPLKERYRETPGAALVTLRAQGRVGAGVSCRLETRSALVVAGLHPATGGDRCGRLLRRHAAGGAGGLRGRDAERGGDFARHQLRAAGWRRKATSTSAAPWASPRKRRWAFRTSASAFILDTDAPRNSSAPCCA